MGKIDTQIDLSKDLTLVKATGKMVADDFREWIATYDKGPVTKLLLWNIAEADLSEIRSEDIGGGAALTKRRSISRRGGKSAIVSSDNFGYGIARILEAFYEIEHVSFKVQVFRAIEEAMNGLVFNLLTVSMRT